MSADSRPTASLIETSRFLLEHNRLADPSWPNNATLLATHVLARMEQQGRSMIVMTYNEARSPIFWEASRQLASGGVFPGVDSMLGALLALHSRLGILNHPSAQAMTLSGFVEAHWGITEGLEPEESFTANTPMHFCLNGKNLARLVKKARQETAALTRVGSFIEIPVVVVAGE